MQYSEELVLIAERLTKQVGAGASVLTILREVSFSVRRGESIAIVGASGSGKSTLLSLLAGLDVPSSGGVRALGTNLTQLDEDARAHWRAQHIGFVFQAFHLLPSLNALENVMLPLELNDAQDVAAQATLGVAGNARSRASAMLQRVGMETRLHHYPRTLSGGEQQRVALARAFVAAPRLLFADEPTGSLDAATGEEVIQLMFQLNREQGTTLLLVTHDERVAGHCSRQLRLTAGELVSDTARSS